MKKSNKLLVLFSVTVLFTLHLNNFGFSLDEVNNQENLKHEVMQKVKQDSMFWFKFNGARKLASFFLRIIKILFYIIL